MWMHGLSEHFGGSLLGDLLTSFTDFTPPAKDEVRVGRGALDAPRLGSWSPAKSIERGRKGYLRKYFLHCADRGQNVISGRPRTAASPRDGFSGWFGSGRSDAPRRERLPMTAQQFPAIATSGFVASCMKRTDCKESVQDDQSQTSEVRTRHRAGGVPEGEGKPAPFKYGRKPNLFERRFGGVQVIDSSSPVPSNSKTVYAGKSLQVEAGKSIQVEAKPPEHHTESKMTHKKSSKMSMSFVQKRFSGKVSTPSKSRPSTAAKQPPKSPTISKVVDDESPDDMKKGIWKLRLESTKADRMERISVYRKVKESELLVGERDKVVTSEEIDFAQDAFTRYFRNRKRFDRDRVIEALGDFGIRARTQPEKEILAKSLEECAEKREITFKDFCSIVEECRPKFRSCRYSDIFLAWRTVDTGDIGALDVPQVIKLLHLMNVGPATAVERQMVEARIDELHKDAFGLYSISEVEYLAQQCREHIEASKRREQRRIEEEYDLTAKTIVDFRSYLIPLHDQFKRIDHQETGEISVEDAMFLLSEFGCLLHCPSDIKKEIVSTCVDLVEAREGVGARVSFSWLLVFVRSLRRRTIEQQIEDVTELFNFYDKDKNGELEMKDVCLVIQEMGLLPRTPAERSGIAELLEDVDLHGSGRLHFDALVRLVACISEKLQRVQRETENAKGESLGLSRHQMFELRRTFETLDHECSGTLSPSEVVRAVKMMEWRVSDAKTMQMYDEVDKDGTGSIEFIDFLTLMRKIDLDAHSRDDRVAAEVEPKQTDLSPTSQEEAKRPSSPSKAARKEKVATVSSPVNSKRPENRKNHSRATIFRPSFA